MTAKAQIEIRFGQTTSPNMRHAVKLAHGADVYRTEGEGRATRHISIFRPRHNVPAAKLLKLAAKWQGTEVWLGDRPIPSGWQYQHVLNCYLSAPADTLERQSYCTGCYLLDPAKVLAPPCKELGDTLYAHFWGSCCHWLNHFGSFTADKRYFEIDKSAIRASFEQSIRQYTLDVCPYFHLADVRDFLKSLPPALELTTGSPFRAAADAAGKAILQLA